MNLVTHRIYSFSSLVVLLLLLITPFVHAASKSYQGTILPSQSKNVIDTNSRVTYVISVQPSNKNYSARLRTSSQRILEKYFENAGAIIHRKNGIVRFSDFVEVLDNISYELESTDQLVILFTGDYLVDLENRTAYLSDADTIGDSVLKAADIGFNASRVARYLSFVKTKKIISLIEIDQIGILSQGNIQWKNALTATRRDKEFLNIMLGDIKSYANESTITYAALPIAESPKTSQSIDGLFATVNRSINKDSSSVSTVRLTNDLNRWNINTNNQYELFVANAGVSWTVLSTEELQGRQANAIEQYAQTIEIAKTSISSPSKDGKRNTTPAILETQLEWVVSLFRDNRQDYQALVATWSKEGLLGSRSAYDLYRILNSNSRTSTFNIGVESCKQWLVDLGLLLEKSRQGEIRIASTTSTSKSVSGHRKQSAEVAYDIQVHMANMNGDCIRGK